LEVHLGDAGAVNAARPTQVPPLTGSQVTVKRAHLHEAAMEPSLQPSVMES
jgi:hypothetical protein